MILSKMDLITLARKRRGDPTVEKEIAALALRLRDAIVRQEATIQLLKANSHEYLDAEKDLQRMKEDLAVLQRQDQKNVFRGQSGD